MYVEVWGRRYPVRLCDAMRVLSAARIASGGSSEDEIEEDDDIVAGRE